MKKGKLVNINTKLKNIALSILLIPSIFFLIFAVGETVSGDFSGLSHLIPVFALLIFGFLAYKFALICGIILVIAAIYSLFLYISSAEVFTAVIIFVILPPFISGILLITSSRPK